MKSLRLFKNQTKKGVASIYVVVFATILFGVVTLSFTRIILSEASQSSNDDLSRSAYDAALAGVEDAKLMVNKYYECLQTNGASCSQYDVFDDDCEGGFELAKKLYNITDGEVFIQESNDSTTETSADQAYTCVLVSDVTPDYRGTLTTDTRTKVIPIHINGSGTTSTEATSIHTIGFEWYSDLNQGNKDQNQFNLRNDSTLPSASDKTLPPTIQLTLIVTPKTINLDHLHQENNDDSVIYSTMILLPSTAGDSPKLISNSEIINAGNVDSSNSPFQVNCTRDAEFACRVYLDTPSDIIHNNDDNILLVASLPYGDAFTDFAVKLYNKKPSEADFSSSSIPFQGAQISVDSTGRTNQLFRRVETRLDPADLFFPYPQFALEAGGGDEDSIRKNFWVTANCWTEQGNCNNNGNL